MPGRYQGHPLVKLAGTVARLPRYLKLAKALFRDPSISAIRKTALAGGIAYAILPFDVIPPFIPILGQLDDLAMFLLGIRVALAGLPPEVAQAQLARAGLSGTALDADLQTVRQAAVWLLEGGAKLGIWLALAPLRALARPKVKRERSPAPLDSPSDDPMSGNARRQ